MTSLELLQLLNDARDSHLLEAQFSREAPVQTAPPRLSVRKLLLIAALIALTLLLVGCTVVYVLRLQQMQVGEHTYTEPAYINAAGETVPAEEKTTALVSLQGIYQPALQEWLAFKDRYDPDNALLIANDHNESGVPEPYHTTYGCYTWDMVDALDTIIKKYDLQLLEPYILIQNEESQLLFEALHMENFHREASGAAVSYGSGYFYPEGTFQISAQVVLPDAWWDYKTDLSIRCSLKEYFDPVYSSMGDIESYTQWNYTTENGIAVLLAMNEQSAHIYADLPHAFVSVGMDAHSYDGAPMPAQALEQLAEVLDFTAKPQAADLELVRQKRAEAQAREAAETARQEAMEAAALSGGYERYIAYRLETAEDPGDLHYSLYDLNGDGVEELIVRDRALYCYEILSRVSTVNDGQAFLYFDAGAVTARSEIYPCEGNVIQLYSGYGGFRRYKFYQADTYGVTYLEGLSYSEAENCWYYHPDDDPWTDNEDQILESEAREILHSYSYRALGEAAPMDRYPGLDQAEEDPYAACIASFLAQNPEASGYVLLDLNGDGVEELLIESPFYVNGEPSGTAYGLWSRMHGELVDLNILPISYLCEDGYLEYCSNYGGGESHEYFRLKVPGIHLETTVTYDPLTKTWTRDDQGPFSGPEKTVISEEEARALIASHPRIFPQLTPLSQYPAEDS